MLWFGLGMGIGAAAAGGRLLNALPTRFASRLDDLATKVTSTATELSEKVGGDTNNPREEATMMSIAPSPSHPVLRRNNVHVSGRPGARPVLFAHGRSAFAAGPAKAEGSGGRRRITR